MKTKHNFITDFLFEEKGQFHPADYDMLSPFYDLLQKEYEEKLRWIQVEERLPEKMQTEPYVSEVVQVKSKNFKEPFCAFYNHLHNVWLPYPFGSNSQITGITEWRYFFII